MPVFKLPDELWFPDVEYTEPDGLLAYGGDLVKERLLLAYRSGIFPWYSYNEPILWWSPDPRFILYPDKLKVSETMKKILRKSVFQISFDSSFREVIMNCSEIKRKEQEGTWITNDMINAYDELYKDGFARSVEVWQNNELVGGLYGVQLGNCFFGESMFSKVSNASKAGFIVFVNHLKENGCKLIDCQVYTSHLESLGAEMVARKVFIEQLQEYL